MGIKRPAEEDYNSNVHAKRVKDEDDSTSGQQATLRFLLESKVRTLESSVNIHVHAEIIFFMKLKPIIKGAAYPLIQPC